MRGHCFFIFSSVTCAVVLFGCTSTVGGGGGGESDTPASAEDTPSITPEDGSPSPPDTLADSGLPPGDGESPVDGAAPPDEGPEVVECPEPECEPLWERECVGAMHFSVCGVDSHGCVVESEAIECAPNNACLGGLCGGACVVPEVVLLLDRSLGTVSTSWEFTKLAVQSVVEEADAGVGFGLRLLPGGTGDCAAGLPTAPAVGNAATIVSQLGPPSVDPGVPIADGLALAATLGTPGQGEHVILVVGSGEICTDEASVLAAVGQLRTRGTQVHVISVGFGADILLLEAIAEEAGTVKVYTATNEIGLANRLRDILGGTGVCCVDTDDDSFGPYCAAGADCQPDDPGAHTPSCADKECGDNGCGESCGECETLDNGAFECASGLCEPTCDLGYHLCKGECVNSSSVEHCGESCKPCSTQANAEPTCYIGECGFECAAGYHECTGECVSDDSAEHCGDSCAPCPTDPLATTGCAGGECTLVCDPGTTMCEGGCTACPDDVGVDGVECVGGACVAASCLGGFFECGDTCCDTLVVDLDTVLGPMIGSAVGYTSLARSATGAVHVAWYKRLSQFAGEARYATGQGDGFAVSTIASGAYEPFGKFTNLVLDPLGGLHVAYRGGPNKTQREMVHGVLGAGGEWALETLADTSTTWPYHETDFALVGTLTGAPVAVYPSDSRLSVAYKVGFAVQWSTVAQVEDQLYTDPPVAIVDSDGLTHVMYLEYSNTQKRLTYAIGGETVWTSMVVDDSVIGLGSHRFDIALDGDERVVACYLNNDPDGKIGLYLARQTEAGDFELESVDVSAQQSCSLGLDAAGLARVVYRTADGDLRYAEELAVGGWDDRVLAESVGTQGLRWPSMAFAKDGSLHVAYWDQDAAKIRYLFAPNP